jgi:two-component system nitrogen regulation response regulator NtrX
MSDKGNILVVDDEAEVRALVSDVLSDEGYNTIQASNEQEALAIIKKNVPDLIFLDLWINEDEFAGIKILEKIKKFHPDVPVVMISGHGTIDLAVQAIQKGASDFIEKPFVIDRMLITCNRVLELRRLKHENAALKNNKLENNVYAVGMSQFAMNIVQTIDKIAITNSRIFIKSPVGIGANAIAYSIHKKSSRREFPFVYVNCISSNSEKFDRDFFGTERSIGYLQKANYGTIFLEDISKLSVDFQRKLMSSLRENNYVAFNKASHADVRIICSASDESILHALESGLFSRELFYRLHIAEINVPGLKERREDIIPLVKYYLSISEQLFGLPRKDFSDKSLAILQSYDWPGNIYQIKNIVESSLINASDSDDPLIQEHHLPNEVTSSTKEKFDSLNSAKFISLPLKEAKERFESDYLRVQVDRFDGNISQTANFIGMERSALHRKLKSLNVARKIKG